jgi:hypothetical protein
MAEFPEPREPIYGVELFDDLHIYLPDLLYNSSRFASVQDLLQYVQQQTRANFNLYNRGALQYQREQERVARETPPQLPRRVRPAAAEAAETVAAPPAPRYAPAPPLVTPLLSTPIATGSATVAAETGVPITQPPSMRMLPTPIPPAQTSTPAEATVPASAEPASAAPAAAGAGATSLHTTTYARQQFNTASGRSVQSTPFRSPRAANATPSFRVSYPANAGLEFGATPLGTSLLGFDFQRFDDGTAPNLGNTNQLLTSLLGLAFGDTGGAAIGGLPASFLEPVVVRPTPAQIDAASEVVSLFASLEGNCAVCQDGLDTGQQVRRLNACGHNFHQECIDTWFERSVQCPVCRHDIREPAAAAAPVPAPEQENVD